MITVAELRKIAAEMNIAGRSKMTKPELILAVGDACYDEATAEYDHRNEVEMLTSYEPAGESDIEVAFWEVVNATPDVSFRTGMTTQQRLNVYKSQAHGGNKLTAKQLRRINKKILQHR